MRIVVGSKGSEPSSERSTRLPRNGMRRMEFFSTVVATPSLATMPAMDTMLMIVAMILNSSRPTTVASVYFIKSFIFLFCFVIVCLILLVCLRHNAVSDAKLQRVFRTTKPRRLLFVAFVEKSIGNACAG